MVESVARRWRSRLPDRAITLCYCQRGVIGQGIGQGFPTYIPVVHSDFAFAAVAEEWGLIGSMTMLGSFVFLVYRGMRIAGRQRGSFASYLAAGMTVLLGSQSTVDHGRCDEVVAADRCDGAVCQLWRQFVLLNSVILGLLLYLSAESIRRAMNNLNTPRQYTSGLGIVLILCLFAVGAYLFYWVALRSDMLLNETIRV